MGSSKLRVMEMALVKLFRILNETKLVNKKKKERKETGRGGME